MGARAEALARQFETKAHEVSTVLERLSEADWKKTTVAEKWPVGVVAHHLASVHEAIAGIAKSIAEGKPGPYLTMDALRAMNAEHAKDHANCTKAETLVLHKKNAATAAAIVRGLDDTHLDRSATVLAGMPPASAAQFVERELIGHLDVHLDSIRATVAG
ncbi:MAG TPA: DinB family protein [Candidatus Methylomirabilis sp.]|nr:DinB family protein [Candidatus Methylomirabilis sp.]